MATRVTRSSVAKAMKLVAASKTKNSVELQFGPAVSSRTTDVNTAEANRVPNGKSKAKLPTIPKKSQGKRKRNAAKVEDSDELPHNLGKIVAVEQSIIKEDPDLSTNDDFNEQPRAKRTITQITSKKEEIGDFKATAEQSVTTNISEKAPSKSRKRKANPYGFTPGVTPFPDWPHPTLKECQEVNDLLSQVHGVHAAPAAIPPPSLTVSGCGEVPSVLDAMLRTLLSAATAGSNSDLAMQGLISTFGVLKEGIGKGSVDWNAVRRADQKEVFKAIERGGLGDSKSKYIKAILEMVYEENQSRRDALLQAQETANPDVAPKGAENETPAQKAVEIIRADQHVLSLDHFHALETNDAMEAMMRYPGIGVKTASCVTLFCLRRPSFAVDTHVFRFLKWLKWVPATVKNEIAAFNHVEVRVPDELKYSLHQLFIKHGKTCPRCRAATGEGCEDWDKGCIIDHLVERTGKRKGLLAEKKAPKEEKVSAIKGTKKKAILKPPAKKVPTKKSVPTSRKKKAVSKKNPTHPPSPTLPENANSGAPIASGENRIVEDGASDAGGSDQDSPLSSVGDEDDDDDDDDEYGE